MARRTLINIDERILEAVIEVGANEGISGVTSVKVAKMCGVSHFTCFDHFGTKQNLLDQAAIKFENEYIQMLMSYMSVTETIEELWLEMLGALTKSSNGLLYYMNYITEFGYKPTPYDSGFDTFRDQVIKKYGENPAFNDKKYKLIWQNIVSQCFVYASFIVKKFIPDTTENRLLIRDMVFKGMEGIFSQKKD